jgi:NitT/TauT family transport system permease protein
MTDAAPDTRAGGVTSGRTALAARPAFLASEKARTALASVGWGVASISLFAAIWELCSFLGWADRRLLPPPHVFLGDIPDQLQYFNTATRWAVGVNQADAPSGLSSLITTVFSTMGRVVVGLLIASVLAVTVGVLARYYRLFDRLTMPTVMLLSSVSPIAWLPVAVFLFGIGNGPAVFMVVIALFFHMVIATVAHIDNVPKNLIHVARTMGATKRQVYFRVIIPAILPAMLMVLRLNLFAAWMVVLVAESTGVGHGLGQIIMLARNTFNPSLVFFTIALIGVLGFLTDYALRMVQRRLLYWLPDKGTRHAL